MNLAIVTSESSVGLWWYGRQLVAALNDRGHRAQIAARPGYAGTLNHFQLGNSSRNLLRYIALSRNDVITLHDVVARNRSLRPWLAALQTPLLKRHRVVVHSEFAAEMLRGLKFTGRVFVVPLGVTVRRYTESEISETRHMISRTPGPILATAGILKVGKSLGAVFSAAERHPEANFAFIGRAADEKTAKWLESAPDNVVHIGNADDETFSRCIAASDLLLNFRTESVGEASGPATLAHALGTPILGYSVGFMNEYRSRSDLLFPVDVAVSDAVGEALANFADISRVAADDSSITSWAHAAQLYEAIYRD